MTMQLTANQIGSSLKAGIEAGIEAGIGSGLAEALAGTIRLNNVLSSIHAYADMSPDMAMRRQVNSWMLRRAIAKTSHAPNGASSLAPGSRTTQR